MFNLLVDNRRIDSSEAESWLDLPMVLVDRRAAKVTAVHDETWLRVVDVHQALTARGYAGDGDVTVCVTDSLLHNNSATSPSAATELHPPTGDRKCTSASKDSAP